MNKDDAAVFNMSSYLSTICRSLYRDLGINPSLQPSSVRETQRHKKLFFLFDRKKNKNNIQNNKLIQALTSEINVLNNLTKANISC